VRGGLVTSVVLHAAILGWALFTIQAQRELRVAEPEPIAVDLVNASELTRLRQGVRTAKQLEAEPKEAPKAEPTKKEAPKPTPVAAAPPPPAPDPPPPKEEPKKEEPPKEVAAATPPPPAAVPVPAPDEQKKLDEMLKEQERKAEEQKKIEEEKRQAELKKKQAEAKKKKEAELKKKREEEKKRKEAEAKKKFDTEQISALLNKIPDKGAPRPSVPLNEQAKEKGPILGAPEGRDRQISASEIAILAQIIRSCVQSKWNVMGGGEGAQHTVVKLRLRFNADGTLAAAPVIMNPQSTPGFLAISDSAIRAAQACEPYSLPPAKYEIWKDIVLNFDPRDMF